MSDPFDALLDSLLPGAGETQPGDGDVPALPTELDLEPLGVIASGGEGWVLRAHDRALDREVAVKVARDGGDERLRREAQRTARLSHPAVLPVIRMAEIHGRVWVVFPMAPRSTLATVDGSARAFHAKLAIIAAVAGAVERAHSTGLVHGDLHPGNIALDDDDSPYVLDWSGGGSPGALHAHPGYAAPECLHGEPPTTASDVWSLACIAWELLTGRPARPRRPGEELGDYIARWRDHVPEGDGSHPSLLTASLARDPAGRPDAGALRESLLTRLSAEGDRLRRLTEAAALAAASRDFARRHREVADAIAAEDRVVAVQRAKSSPHADPILKRALWESEDRRAALLADRSELWVDAVEAAMRAATLDPESRDAKELLASLWWERLLRAERHGPAEEIHIAERRVRASDSGRFTSRLGAASHLTLTSSVPARVVVSRHVTHTRAWTQEPIGEWTTPLERLELSPGSYLLTLSAPGREVTRYPVALGRLEHHVGEVTLFAPDEIGEGWIHVPAGPFRMGGDPRARQPLDACDPHVGDFFVQRTCVRSRDWKLFLDSLEPEIAARHVPGEGGLFGGFRTYWILGANGAEMPDGWDPDWPIMAVNLSDAHAYAAWLSRREGRTVRLPTEEEWEKAARGVDGRWYPWGDGFDATWCRMRESVSGAPRPARVASYPMDMSPYSVLDMAGGVREWTSSLLSDGQIVIRGGTWGDDADDCRVACRSGLQPDFRFSFVGFRLVAEQPRS